MSLRPKGEVLIHNHFKIPHPDESGFGMTCFAIMAITTESLPSGWRLWWECVKCLYYSGIWDC